MEIGLSEISLNLDEEPPAAKVAAAPVSLMENSASDTASDAAGGAGMADDDAATKLDLAKAYQEMGDNEGAREILQEVVREGNEQQRAAAQALLEELPA